jgi:phosphopantothenoylcysteine decarboxylase/phosphopantothenate--cysteine ligase
MNCIVTAGPTCEPLDEVRRLTNFSTGRLGSELANHLAACGHQVTLLLGTGATFHTALKAQRVVTFTTTADLRSSLAALSGSSVGAVFHAAAVSDFAFGSVFQRGAEGVLTECREEDPDRGAGPSRRVDRHTQPLDELRTCSHARLAWSYEVQGDPASVVAKARATDAAVAPMPAWPTVRLTGQGSGLSSATGPACICAIRRRFARPWRGGFAAEPGRPSRAGGCLLAGGACERDGITVPLVVRANADQRLRYGEEGDAAGPALRPTLKRPGRSEQQALLLRSRRRNAPDRTGPPRRRTRPRPEWRMVLPAINNRTHPPSSREYIASPGLSRTCPPMPATSTS